MQEAMVTPAVMLTYSCPCASFSTRGCYIFLLSMYKQVRFSAQETSYAMHCQIYSLSNLLVSQLICPFSNWLVVIVLFANRDTIHISKLSMTHVILLVGGCQGSAKLILLTTSIDWKPFALGGKSPFAACAQYIFHGLRIWCSTGN